VENPLVVIIIIQDFVQLIVGINSEEIIISQVEVLEIIKKEANP
jgi:hypothetical protein